ncbi:hypothetical protein MRX96_023535 [Rhipicephalus microplus]
MSGRKKESLAVTALLRDLIPGAVCASIHLQLIALERPPVIKTRDRPTPTTADASQSAVISLDAWHPLTPVEWISTVCLFGPTHLVLAVQAQARDVAGEVGEKS